ncbi:hypothetical protein D3C76_992530 [compost metagenome]
MAEFALDHRRQLIVLMGQGGFEVERDHRRLRMAGGFDLVVDLGQVGFGLAQQQDGGAMGGIGFGGGGTNAAASAGDQDDPAFEQIGAGGIIKHEKPHENRRQIAARPFAGKPAPTGPVEGTEFVITPDLVGAGLPAKASAFTPYSKNQEPALSSYTKRYPEPCATPADDRPPHPPPNAADCHPGGCSQR